MKERQRESDFYFFGTIAPEMKKNSNLEKQSSKTDSTNCLKALQATISL